MPRPQLAVGDYGSVSYSYNLPTVTAKCRFRGLDGNTRQVSATGIGSGRTEKAVRSTGERNALANLKAKIDEMKRGSGDINSETRLKDIAEVWYAGKQTEGLAHRTLERSRSILDNHVIPKIGGLRIREATTARLDLFIRDLTVGIGPASARIVRSVLSGIFTEAQRYDAVVGNPVEATRVPKMEKSEIRALTLDAFLGMRKHAEEKLRPLTREERLARANGDLRRMGGPNKSRTPLDVIDFLIGTGARASEVLGLCWADVHVDEEVPWVKIHQQVSRKKGEGLILTPTKERDERNLALPRFAVEMLRRRRSLPGNEWGAVFASNWNTLIDPRTMRRLWQNLFEGTEWEWVTQKTLRKTVATLINLELGSEIAAKQLGHASDTMTKKHYIEPSRLPSDQRVALEAFGA